MLGTRCSDIPQNYVNVELKFGRKTENFKTETKNSNTSKYSTMGTPLGFRQLRQEILLAEMFW